MAADDAGERTEAPTPRRRQEAREDGQVARSTDLTAAVALLVGLSLLNGFGPGMFQRLLELTRELGDMSDVAVGSLQAWGYRAGMAAVAILGPFLLILLLSTAAGGMLQTGGLVAWRLLTPKIENLDPSRGFKRLFSGDSLTRLAQSLLKMAFVAGAAWFGVRGQIDALLGVGMAAPLTILQRGGELVFA